MKACAENTALVPEIHSASSPASTSSDTLVSWSISAEQPLTMSSTESHNGIIRWYDPVTGRWLSKDPTGIINGLNLYAFCFNNPVNFYDPYGERVYVVARKLAFRGGGVGVHTYVEIIPDNPQDFGGDKRWTLSGYKNAQGKLQTTKNWKTDFNWSGPVKLNQLVPTPKGKTDTQFIQDIMAGFNRYKSGSRDYEAFPEVYDNEGNCNNVTSGALMAGGVSKKWLKGINPRGANPGIGQALPEMLKQQTKPSTPKVTP